MRHFKHGSNLILERFCFRKKIVTQTNLRGSKQSKFLHGKRINRSAPEAKVGAERLVRLLQSLRKERVVFWLKGRKEVNGFKRYLGNRYNRTWPYTGYGE